MTDRDQFRQLMGEAAAHSADERERREIECRVEEHGAWAQQEWRELLQESEVLRRELPRISVPEGLEQSLLALARDASPPAASLGRRWVVAAAVAALVVAGVGLAHHFTIDSRLRTVSLLAINNHLNHLDDHGVHQQADRRELEHSLTSELPFAVTVPDLGPELELVGGRTCKLGTHAVALSLWDGLEGECSLFQFEPDDFGLPSPMPRTLIHTYEPAAADHTCGAWIWCDGTRGYVLVGDPGCELEDLTFGE